MATTKKLRGVTNQKIRSRAEREATNHEVTNHAIRWTRNILVELLSNYGAEMAAARRSAMKQAIDQLNIAEHVPVIPSRG